LPILLGLWAGDPGPVGGLEKNGVFKDNGVMGNESVEARKIDLDHSLAIGMDFARLRDVDCMGDTDLDEELTHVVDRIGIRLVGTTRPLKFDVL
jgi:hypothetical protein